MYKKGDINHHKIYASFQSIIMEREMCQNDIMFSVVHMKVFNFLEITRRQRPSHSS